MGRKIYSHFYFLSVNFYLFYFILGQKFLFTVIPPWFVSSYSVWANNLVFCWESRPDLKTGLTLKWTKKALDQFRQTTADSLKEITSTKNTSLKEKQRYWPKKKKGKTKILTKKKKIHEYGYIKNINYQTKKKKEY